MASPVILRVGESNKIFPVLAYAPGVYLVPVQPNNNALLSSFLVKAVSPGASAVVNYWQTTSENESFERTDISSHLPVAAAQTSADQILVTKIHNKVWAELVITGGAVTCGVYGTAVGYSAFDFEGDFRKEGETANLSTDLGLPIMGVDENGDYVFPRFQDNKLVVLAEISEIGQQVYQFGEALSVPSGSLTTIVSYTVPATKTLTLRKIAFSGQNIARFSCLIDTDVVNKQWTYFGNLSGSFDFGDGGLTATAGQVVTCKTIHQRPDFGDFAASIYGVLQ